MWELVTIRSWHFTLGTTCLLRMSPTHWWLLSSLFVICQVSFIHVIQLQISNVSHLTWFSWSESCQVADQQVVNNFTNAKVLYSFNPPPTQITSRWICFKAVLCGWAITTQQYKITCAKHWLLNTPLHCIICLKPTLYPMAFWCQECHANFLFRSGARWFISLVCKTTHCKDEAQHNFLTFYMQDYLHLSV